MACRNLPRPHAVCFLASWFALCFAAAAAAGPPKEFLTEKEIEKIQNNPEIHRRVKLYMEYAALRLKTAEDRLSGTESEPGDPLEFFAPEDMLDGYRRILESVMINLEDAYEKADPYEKARVRSALRSLKSTMESALPRLEILKKIVEEKDKEALWGLATEGLEISRAALEGADSGISSLEEETDPGDKKAKKK